MKILLAYDSTREQTILAAKQAAELIRRQNKADIELVDLRVRRINVLVPYDKIILCGSVWQGKVENMLVDYIWKNREEFLIKPLYIMMLCYEDEAKFMKAMSHDLPLDVLEHSETFNVGMDVDISDLNPISRLKWKLSGQKITMPFSGESLQTFADKVALS